MHNGRLEYTFYWFIENYSYCWHKNGKVLISPNFTLIEFENTTWNLELYPRGNEENKEELTIFLNRLDQDDGPRNVSLKGEIMLLAADGSVISKEEISKIFKKGDAFGEGLLPTKELFLEKSAYYLPQDTLNVCCKMYKGEGTDYNIGQSSARTRIRVEKNSFLHVIENFSKLQQSVNHRTKIGSYSKRGRYMTSSLYFTVEDIVFEIVLSDTCQILGKCEISLIDGSRNIIRCGGIDNRYEAAIKNRNITILSLSREAILGKKSEYLPNDKLSLICEFNFSSGIQYQIMEESLHEVPPNLIQQKSFIVPEKNDFKAAKKVSAYPGMLEDIETLYINQRLTDMEVKTKTKSFPAHKVVLCARSPVFEAMLTNDMREKNTSCVQVDDLEDDIVQQLLFFLYTDNIKDMQWETTSSLYYAADKYQIGKLKEVCSSFLLENLTTNKAAEVLLLADTHNDSDLKKSVEDFILDHEEVFGSKEWEMLMETNPLLAMKTMHLKYKRNQ